MKPEAFDDEPHAKSGSDLSLKELEKKLSVFELKMDAALDDLPKAPAPVSKKHSTPEKESQLVAELRQRIDQMEQLLQKETASAAAPEQVEDKLRDLEKQIGALNADFKKALTREPKPAARPLPGVEKKSPAGSIFKGFFAGFVIAATVWAVSFLLPDLRTWISQASSAIRQIVYRETPEESPVPPAELQDIRVREREFKMVNALLYYMERADNPQVRAKAAGLLKSWPWKGVPEHLLMVAREDSDPIVTRTALATFASMTGYRGDKNSDAAEEWWRINQDAVNLKLIG